MKRATTDEIPTFTTTERAVISALRVVKYRIIAVTLRCKLPSRLVMTASIPAPMAVVRLGVSLPPIVATGASTVRPEKRPVIPVERISSRIEPTEPDAGSIVRQRRHVETANVMDLNPAIRRLPEPLGA
jgi:hypothetical protein